MARRIFFIVLLLVLLFTAIIGGYGLYAPTVVESNNLSRQVSTQWMLGPRPITVTTGIDLSSYAVCERQRAQLDVVMLIDVSGSMAGDAFADAISAADTFITALQLRQSDLHQVSVAFFNHELVRPLIPLTNDATLIRNGLSAISPDGGTNFVPPLSYARSELESIRRRPRSLPVILFFSDGSSSDAPQAIQLANEIKQRGGQIFVVGLRGDDFNPDDLAAIASGPETLSITPTSAELITLFDDIAQTVNSYVLQNVSYSEPLALDQVTLLPNSVPAGIDRMGNGLRFSADAMTGEETRQFQGFAYQVEPNRLGLVDVNSAPATLSLEACGGAVERVELPQGPRLMVLPILPVALAIPLGVLFLAGLPFFFGRRKPTESGDVGPRKVEPPPPPPPPRKDAFGQWLATADHMDAEQGVGGDGLTNTPTLIVGLGSTGRTVLQQIAERLNERTGGQWPENLKMLQISLPDVEGIRDPLPPLPSQVNEVSFRRSLDRQSLDEPYMGWAKDNSGTRIKGRMSLFTDLSNGKTESQLWGPMGNVLANQRNITVWIITDGFGPASGIIADIAHLLRVRTGSNIIESVRLCLAMHNAGWSSRTSTGLSERCYATVRELQRLQIIQETPFVYTNIRTQPELQATHRGKMLDEIYLFDGVGQNPDAEIYDISRLPADKGVLRAITNAMLALLERNMASSFYQNEKNAQSQIARGGGVDAENYGSAMGCAILRAPIEPTRRLAELRLIHQTLFDPVEGLWGWGTLTDKGEPQPSASIQVTFREEEVADFIREVGAPDRLKISSSELQRYLAEYLHEKMNEGDRIGLRWAERFLQALLDRGYPESEIQPFYRQSQEWLALVGSAPQTAVSRSPRSSVRQPDRQAPLVQAWANAWQQVQDSFPKAEELEPEQFAWTLDDVNNIYAQYLGTMNAAQRLRKRTFWYWSTHAGLELRLVILPPNLSDPIAGTTVRDQVRSRLHTYTYGIDPVTPPTRTSATQANPAATGEKANNEVKILDALRAAARPFSREILKETRRLEQALNRPEMQRRLNRNASPLFRTVQIGGEIIATNRRRILVPPADMPVYLPEVNTDGQVSSQDPTTCIVFHAQHVVRFGNMQAYVDARENYMPDASLFVFPAEQQAARRERSARRQAPKGTTLTFSPQATALLEKDADMVDALGSLLLNGHLQLVSAGSSWYVQIQTPELAFVHDGRAADLLNQIVQTSRADAARRDILIELAKSRQPTADDRSRLEMQMEQLALAEQPGVRDLAVIIAEALDRI
jgi:uncharacterized protein YegL